MSASHGDSGGCGGSGDASKAPPASDDKRQPEAERSGRTSATEASGERRGSWTDPYTKRRAGSRAFSRMSGEEVEAVVHRLRKPTISSTGAEALRDKQYVYLQPKYTKTNPQIRRRRQQDPRSVEDCEAIASRLHSAKTRAWTARREPNPNTRVHYSTDFTII